MSELNPYQPVDDVGVEAPVDPQRGVESGAGQPMHRVLYAIIGVIALVLLTFTLSEIAITIVVSTPLSRFADLDGEYDGLVVVLLPIFTIPSAICVGFVQGASRGSNLGRWMALALSIVASIGVFFYVMMAESNSVESFSVAFIVLVSLVASVCVLHSFLGRITQTRDAGSSAPNMTAGRSSAIFAAAVTTLVLVLAFGLAITSDFGLITSALVFVYMGGVTIAVMSGLYNLAAFRGRYWISWASVACALCSPILIVAIWTTLRS